MATLDDNAISSLKGKMDSLTAQPTIGAPGIAYVAVNKDGKTIFEHASGTIGAGIDKPVTMDSVFWLASCTKMLTGIAVMQLVEQGKLNLEDPDQVERLAPELKELQVMQDDGTLVPKERRITLKMLLNHTAGFTYTFFSPKLLEWAGPIGVDEWSCTSYDHLRIPLVNQPGSRCEYGISLDWAGALVERASGLSLDKYFKAHILEPLDLHNTSFFPSTQMKRDLMYMNVRGPDGTITRNKSGQTCRRPLIVQTQEEIDCTFNAGGAGLFGRPCEYAQVISAMLNDGLHAPTGHRLLKKETVDLMWSNSVPLEPRFTDAFKVTKPDGATPTVGGPPQGFGLSCALQLGDSSAHSAGTTFGGGLPNLAWWADRKRGIGGFGAAQVLPIGDVQLADLWYSMGETINAHAK